LGCGRLTKSIDFSELVVSINHTAAYNLIIFFMVFYQHGAVENSIGVYMLPTMVVDAGADSFVVHTSSTRK